VSIIILYFFDDIYESNFIGTPVEPQLPIWTIYIARDNINKRTNILQQCEKTNLYRHNVIYTGQNPLFTNPRQLEVVGPVSAAET